MMIFTENPRSDGGPLKGRILDTTTGLVYDFYQAEGDEPRLFVYSLASPDGHHAAYVGEAAKTLWTFLTQVKMPRFASSDLRLVVPQVVKPGEAAEATDG